MPKKIDIKIDDLSGIHRVMAEKANVNGGNTLKDIEISLFNDMETTYNPKNNTFIFGGEFYDSRGNIAQNYSYHVEPAVSTNVKKPELPSDIVSELKNFDAINEAKEYAKQAEKRRQQTVRVIRNINGKKVTFTYNIASLEDYIINNSKDAKGNKITYFSDIPAIRQKAFALRTKEECQKLIEFNNMLSLIIEAGKSYGVDPKLIVAIIQREVNFEGLDSKVCGANGKGYMQITSAPVKDMLGGYTKKGKLVYSKELKTDKYGNEFVQLLKSRGFNPNCPPNERGALVQKIMKYLQNNNDAEFNIRLGTIILRQQLENSDGNIKTAAQNYNGNNKNGIKYAYGKAVNNYYQIMSLLERNTTA